MDNIKINKTNNNTYKRDYVSIKGNTLTTKKGSYTLNTDDGILHGICNGYKVVFINNEYEGRLIWWNLTMDAYLQRRLLSATKTISRDIKNADIVISKAKKTVRDYASLEENLSKLARKPHLCRANYAIYDGDEDNFILRRGSIKNIKFLLVMDNIPKSNITMLRSLLNEYNRYIAEKYPKFTDKKPTNVLDWPKCKIISKLLK
jgi:hypothetical protein